jgi:hypothetical protein
MTELVLYSFFQGFGLALFLYFVGFIVPLIQSFARWK